MKGLSLKMNNLVEYLQTYSERSWTFDHRMSSSEQTFFIKRLSFLAKAGIPILDSLLMIREQTKSKPQTKILDKIIHDVANGKSLSAGLTKFPKTFSDFSINIIALGESSGILSENLDYLADELKKKQQIKRKIISAFIYPVVISIATLGITGFLVMYLFPKILPVFKSLHINLPLSTRIIIFLSEFIRSNGLFLFCFIALSVVVFLYLLTTNIKIKRLFDKSILKLPIIGQIVKDYILTNSTRTLGLLLKSGLTLSDSVAIVEKTTPNLVYKNEFRKLVTHIERGDKMSVYLNSKQYLFPVVMSQIISVGERSGNLSNSLIYLSELYETQVDEFTKNLSNLIEPILMIIMGVLVGFIAISIITPIYSITQNLQG